MCVSSYRTIFGHRPLLPVAGLVIVLLSQPIAHLLHDGTAHHGHLGDSTAACHLAPTAVSAGDERALCADSPHVEHHIHSCALCSDLTPRGLDASEATVATAYVKGVAVSAPKAPFLRLRPLWLAPKGSPPVC